MATTKVGGPTSAESSNTFSYTSVKVGNLLTLTLGTGFDSSPATSTVASSHGTWTRATQQAQGTGVGNVPNAELWYCTVATVGTFTITVTPTGTNGTDEATATEFDSGLGTSTTWVLSSSAHLSATTAAAVRVTGLVPAAGDLVVAWCQPLVSSPGATMTPSGFVAAVTPNGYGHGYQLSAVGGSITPTWTTGTTNQAFNAVAASFTPSAGSTTWNGTVPFGVATALAAGGNVTHQPAVGIGVVTSLATTPLRETDGVVTFGVQTQVAVAGQDEHDGTATMGVATGLSTTGVVTHQPTVTYATQVGLALAAIHEDDGATPLGVAVSLGVQAGGQEQGTVGVSVSTALALSALVTHSGAVSLGVQTALGVTPGGHQFGTIPLSVAVALLAVGTHSGGLPEFEASLWLDGVEYPLTISGWFDGVEIVPIVVAGQWNGTVIV